MYFSDLIIIYYFVLLVFVVDIIFIWANSVLRQDQRTRLILSFTHAVVFGCGFSILFYYCFWISGYIYLTLAMVGHLAITTGRLYLSKKNDIIKTVHFLRTIYIFLQITLIMTIIGFAFYTEFKAFEAWNLSIIEQIKKST